MKTDKIPGLIADIQLGKQSLAHIAQNQALVMRSAETEHELFRTSAGGVVLQDFYNTIEKTFQQIAQEIDGSVPSGDAWHQQLLQRMTIAIPNRRPPVIDEALGNTFGYYLRFRHLFRHIYGFELEWDRIEPLLTDLPGVLEAFLSQLDDFIGFLQTLSPNWFNLED